MSVATLERPKHFVRREGGEFERQQFQIAASQEAFRILSDGLYSDKIRAVIRELSTNAVDSHIMAGNSDVFEVHLPTYEEPWFSVRDYGTGLVHDDVMNLYSTYFGTNKAENLDTTGCLGLGSKSPLAKVRSFTVISRFGGLEKHYIVALNEDRIPEVNHLPEQARPTTDTGMEIKMAVETGDISEYARKAGQVYRYFAEGRRPRVVNGKEYRIPEMEVLIEGNGWRMYKGDGQPVAVQGNVGYPITSAQINDLSPHQEAVLSCNLEIDFPNGSLAFVPSREHLSYNKMTCQALRDRLDVIVAEVNDTIGTRFGNCKTLWEARVLAWSMFWSTNADLRHLKKLADTGEITWKGQKIAGQQLSFSEMPGVEGWSFELTRKSRSYWSDKYTTSIPRKDRKEYTPRENVVWMEVDLPRGSYARCQQYVRENENSVVYLVSFSTSEERQTFCDKMGLDGTEFIKTSTLPKPPTAQRSGGKFHRSMSLVYKHNNLSSGGRLYDHWTETEVDLDDGDGGVYVEMKNNKAIDVHGRRVHPNEVTEVVNMLRKVTGDKVVVIGVRPQIAKRFRKSDDWVDIWTYARKVVQIQVVQNGLAKHIVNAEHLRNLEYSRLWASLAEKAECLGPLNPDGAMYRLVEGLRHLQKSEEVCPAYATWRTLAKHCNIAVEGESERKASALIKQMYRIFPVLKTLVEVKTSGYYSGQSFSKTELENLRHYIMLVEGQDSGLTNPEYVI